MGQTSGGAHVGRPSIATKLGYGLGAASDSIVLAAVAGYAMFYYNQVLGLSATLAGLAMTASVFFDGLLDPLIGSISDRTRSKLGRRHPFMFAAPLPTALCFYAVFNPPDVLPEAWLFVWFLGFVVTLKIAMSVYQVPHLALGGELATDYTERTRVMSYANLMGAAGSTLTAFVALTFFFNATPAYPRGLMNPAGYVPFGIAAALAVAAFQIVSALLTARHIPDLTQPAEPAAFRLRDFVRDVGMAFSNPNYVFLLIGVFFLALMVGLRTAMNLYINTFFWQLTSEQIRWLSFSSLAGFFFSFLGSAWLHGRFDKRRALVGAAVMLGVVPAVPVLLRAAGWFPETGSPALLPLIMLFGLLQAGIGSVMSITALSALADIADENELRFGVRQEGVLFSTRAVFAKLDNAAGTFLAGLAIDLAGLPEKAIPGAIHADIGWRMAMVDGPLAIIPGVVAAFFYARFRIDQRSHAATRAALAARRAEAESQQVLSSQSLKATNSGLSASSSG